MRDALITEYKLRDLLVAHVVDGSAPAPVQLQGQKQSFDLIELS